MKKVLAILHALRLAAFHVAVFFGSLLLFFSIIDPNPSHTATGILGGLLLIFVPFAATHLTVVAIDLIQRKQGKKTFCKEIQSQTIYGISYTALTYAAGGIVIALLVLAMAVSYLNDRDSKRDAAERNDQEVPSSTDPDTWDTENEMNEYSIPVSATMTYPLTYENIASGNIALTHIRFTYEGDNIGLGAVLFKNGRATDCIPAQNNSFYTCESFKPDMLRIKDVAEIPDTSSGVPEGVAILELHTEGAYTTVLATVRQNKSPNDRTPSSARNTYGTHLYDDFDQIKGDLIDVAYQGVYTSDGVVRYELFSVQSTEGSVQVVFETTSSRYYNANLALYADGKVYKRHTLPGGHEGSIGYPTGELVVTYELGGDFHTTGFYNGTRYSVWQTEEPAERMYHQDACGMPYTFSDGRLRLQTTQAYSSGLALFLNVSVPDGDTYNLTTAQYGYDPQKWGTIVDTVSVDSYFNSVRSGTAFNGYSTEIRTVAGVPVRHTLPRNPPRPCDAQIYEQYQWVAQGNLYSLDISYRANIGITPQERSDVEAILEQLVTDVAYVPASLSSN